jgi:membrane fusion protein (multidrug efflux system)
MVRSQHSGILRLWTARLFPLLLLSLACSAGSLANAAAKEAAAPAGPPPAVVVQELRPQTVAIPSDFVARTVADQTVEICARIEGVLIEMSFEEGKKVQKDQVLFRIDPALYEANLQTAKAQLAKAQADLTLAQDKVSIRIAEANVKQAEASLVKADQDVARLEPLVKEEAVPQQDLDAAVAQQKVAQADLESAKARKENTALTQKVDIEQALAAIESGKAAVAKAELDLSYTVIKSPIDGIIGRQEVSVGNLVGRGEPTQLATVSTMDPMRIDFSLSEADYLIFMKRRLAGDANKAAIELGLVLADGSLYPQKGTVAMIERGLDATTATIPVSASFPNPDSLLRPGLFARVRAEVQQIENALLVPQRAVMEMQGAKSVLVVGPDNVVAARTITLGDRLGGNYLVLNGLNAGDRVIVEGQQKARPGKPVTPAAAAAPATPAESAAPEGK